MRRILSLLLLTAFFLNIIGYHFIFWVQQHTIKENMEVLRHSASIQNPIELRFSLSDEAVVSKLSWEDENEFTFNGELYDVIRKTTINGELVIQCIKDKKETHLVNNYAKISKETQGDPSSKNKSTVLLKLITGIFIKTEQPVLSLPSCISKNHAITVCDALSPGSKKILIPPPQVC